MEKSVKKPHRTEKKLTMKQIQNRSDDQFRFIISELQTIFDSAPIMIFYKDNKNKMLRVNRTYAGIFGRSPEEIVGRTCFELFPEKDAVRYWEDDKRVISSGKPLLGILEEMEAPKGTKRWVRTDKVPYRDENGNIVGVIGFAVDITEQREMERKLREREERLKELFEHMSSAVALYEARNNGADFIFKDFNRAAEKIENITREQVIGKSVAEIFPGIKELGLFDLFQRVYKTGKPEQHSSSFYRDQRISGWKENYVYKLSSGEIVALYDDVTERKQAEEKLKESEQHFRSLVESTSDWVWMIDRNGFYTYASPKVKGLLGYEPAEILGKTPFNLMPSDEAERVMALVQDIRESCKPFSGGENVKLSKDGRLITIETSGTPLFDEQGNYSGYMGFDRDITVRKQTEEALRKVDEQYRRIVDTANEGIVTLDENTLYTFVNERFAEMLGCSVEELIGASHIQFTFEEDIPAAYERIERRSQGIRESFERRFRRKDGSTFWAHITAVPILDEKGLFHGSIAMHADITQKKEAEEALKTSREQLRALTSYLQNVREDERTQIAREIHDELGQTLTGLKMDISWLKNKLHGIKGMPQSIMEKINSLLMLTNSTIQSTRELALKLRPSMLDDLGLIATIEWQTKVFEERSGIRCTFRHKLDEQVVSKELATTYYRILQECLTNIARHADATEVELYVMQTATGITMRIHDNGRGIPLRAINDPASFGLIGMRERVRLLKGKLSITGSPEKGTTVLVSVAIGKISDR